jgi:hypothetical protein
MKSDVFTVALVGKWTKENYEKIIEARDIFISDMEIDEDFLPFPCFYLCVYKDLTWDIMDYSNTNSVAAIDIGEKYKFYDIIENLLIAIEVNTCDNIRENNLCPAKICYI